ncbi:MAG: hypothetical protein QOC71_286, partial [Thermoplasmata archaeon]|nr:hypothetical protein [Thermoplasmata archaeon]
GQGGYPLVAVQVTVVLPELQLP